MRTRRPRTTRSAPCSTAAQWYQRAFVLEQPAFAFDPAAEPRQFSPRPDDAVTGDDDGDRVGPVGGADSSGRLGFAEAAGELTVARGNAVRDRAEQLPHVELKSSPAGFQRQIERGPLSSEILLELLLGPVQHFLGSPAQRCGEGARG